jgi:hypothetical protein
MKPRSLLVFLFLMIAGCESPAQKAASFEKNYDRSVQIYGASCEKIGFKKDTDAWRHCVMTATPFGSIHH